MKKMSQKMKQLAMVVGVATMPAFAMAADLPDIGTETATKIAGLVLTISAIGIAGVSLAIAGKSFGLGYKMIQKIGL